MAFFGLFNYSKPGPGVSKDEPPKAPPVRFFEILWRHLSKIVQLNLIFMIPFLVAAVLMVVIFLLPVQHALYQTWLLGPVDLYIIYAVPLPLVLLGPFNAGMTLITRNFSREEHVFVWSDFWEATAKNWKPALLNACIVYFAYVALSFSIFFYGNQMSENMICVVPFAISCLIAFLMFFAQFYVPVMIVTFDLKLRHIYKNAFIFAVLGFLRNLMLTAIFGLMIASVLFCPGQFIIIPGILLILILFSFNSYLTSFTTYSIIDSYLIQPYYKKEAEANAPKISLEEGEKLSFERDELDDDDAPQYVYVNGRLIDRKLLKEESVFSDETKEHLD